MRRTITCVTQTKAKNILACNLPLVYFLQCVRTRKTACFAGVNSKNRQERNEADEAMIKSGKSLGTCRSFVFSAERSVSDCAVAIWQNGRKILIGKLNCDRSK